MQPPVYRPPGYSSQSANRLARERHERQTETPGERVVRLFYRSARWLAFRAQQLRHEPLCRLCSSRGVVKAATDVDHEPKLRIQLAAGGSGLDPARVQSLCHTCHSAKTRAGG